MATFKESFDSHLGAEMDRSSFVNWYDNADRSTSLRTAVVEIIGGLGVGPVSAVIVTKAAIMAALDR